jgi:hypothetical protein
MNNTLRLLRAVRLALHPLATTYVAMYSIKPQTRHFRRQERRVFSFVWCITYTFIYPISRSLLRGTLFCSVQLEKAASSNLKSGLTNAQPNYGNRIIPLITTHPVELNTVNFDKYIYVTMPLASARVQLTNKIYAVFLQWYY